jgi:serine protease Do
MFFALGGITMKGILRGLGLLLLSCIPAIAQDSGWIGISIEDQGDRGAIIRGVEPNSPAEKAGLKQGDVIVEFNREEVIGVQQLTRLVRETPVGRTVEMKIRRENRDETFKVTTERGPNLRGGRFELALPNVHILADSMMRDMPRVQVSTIYIQGGVRVEQMTDQLRDFFGVYSSNGVLVTSVDSGSPAEKAGLKAGDVITSIDGKNIQSAGDFGRELRAVSKPTLKIIRDKKELEIKIE